MTKIKTILLASLIVMALVITQQAKAISEIQQKTANLEFFKRLLSGATPYQVKQLDNIYANDPIYQLAKNETITQDMFQKELESRNDQVFRTCNSAENSTLCKMGVMGWNDKEAIFMLGLNKSK